MMYSLNRSLRQLIAVMLLVAGVGILGLFIVTPIWSHVANLQDRIDQTRMMVGRLTDAANDDGTRQTLEQQTSAARNSGVFIAGDSEPIRLAALQSSLSVIAASHGVKLRSARNLPPRERFDLKLIGVQVQFVTTIDRLQKILLTVEQHKPTLLIEQLQITPMAISRQPDEDVGLLETRLEIFAIESKQKV